MQKKRIFEKKNKSNIKKSIGKSKSSKSHMEIVIRSFVVRGGFKTHKDNVEIDFKNSSGKYRVY